jgi:nicotinic acid mononucleotide adenylyltransferase
MIIFDRPVAERTVVLSQFDLKFKPKRLSCGIVHNRNKKNSNIIICKNPLYDISSSGINKKLCQKQSIK